MFLYEYEPKESHPIAKGMRGSGASNGQTIRQLVADCTPNLVYRVIFLLLKRGFNLMKTSKVFVTSMSK